MAHYPIHREKVEALKASIRSTGFWDNLMVRRASDAKHFEIAYGHHRLQAIQELISEKIVEPELQIEVSVRNFDDADMLRIMANENVEVYRVTADIIDETVRVTREYIQTQTKTPLDQITASDISQFLGGSWNEARTQVSLQRLSLFDRGTLRREQLNGLSRQAARSVQREVAKVEKMITRDKLAQLGNEEITEQERKRVRAQVQKTANHVAQALSEHLRGGGSNGEVQEKSFDAQVEMIPEDAPSDERKLSAIDAAAQAVSVCDFQRKVELLMRYREYMSEETRKDLAAKLKATVTWCKDVLSKLEEW
ncbi:MAG: ParB N-terminal domain-containing protein [Planctomycetota bacterium]